jgi:HK97 family phage major capsid protein
MADDKKKTRDAPETNEPKRLTKTDLSELIAKTVAEQLANHTETFMKAIDSKVDQKVKPVVDKVTDTTEQWVEDGARRARLAGDYGLEKSFGQVREDVARYGRQELPKNKFSFIRLIMSQLAHDPRLAPFETKALSIGTDASGGYLVPTVMLPEEFIELLTAQIVLVKAGVDVWPNLRGSPIEVPSQTAANAGAWFAENAQITAGDQTLSQLSLQPRKCAAMTKLSRELIMNSAIAAENFVRNDISQQIALAVDLAGLRGTGTNNQPTGIANTSGINTYAIGTNGGEFTPLVAKAMRKELDIDNVDEDGRVWIMHAETFNVLDEQVKASEQFNYALHANIAEGTPKRLLGHPIYISNQIPRNLTKGTSTDCTEVYFGVAKSLVFGYWEGMRLEATSVGGTSFEYDQVWVKGVSQVDVGVKRAVEWCLCSDARDA